MPVHEEHNNKTEPGRLAREKKTIERLIRIYCRGHHDTAGSLCPQCRELCDYALCRLDRCPFGASKSTCAKCPIHCYKPAMRQRIRQVMRYAGPRMLLRHPLLAIMHQLDARRPAPEIQRRRTNRSGPPSSVNCSQRKEKS